MIRISVPSEELVKSYYYEIQESLINRINYVKKNGVTIKGRKYKYVKNRHQAIFSWLEDENNLRQLVSSKPELLVKIIAELELVDPLATRSRSTVNRLLYGIFINTEYNKIDKFNFLNFLRPNTCPYCNRNYIYTIDEDRNVKPEVDHFYPKSIYPFLGISFFNLIPACSVCNGFGGKENMDPRVAGIKSPYLLKDDDFKFSYRLTAQGDKNLLNGFGSIDLILSKKIEGNDTAFNLTPLYKRHNDHIAELIIKSKVMYSDGFKKILKSFEGLDFSESELNRMLIGNYTNVNELHKRPLSKLYRDISIELGIIN